ncbi:CoA transferase [Peribacillus cavernae]|uniref:CoA transferase n=1 Tax=Peribacillus cavernae TaxID=1674310 RepID=A0A3S0VVR3_9BACI|nr:CoA transferase [Peribacillus cavernae]MDQ0219452.1 crotonobetainyl-CoA:carnitine CoA-transferase CaiB-like acyl-CoA transferase [Peribacillus cavernae]RUQ27125.1 CoA transferase [Peribacillus cavernae]
MDQRPLSGITVIDITTSYAGPYCSMLLADMGAEVIKVEKTRAGDDCRHWGPPFINGESAWFLSVNRNKKSVALDIFNPKGREVLYQLVEKADVFLENIKPSSLDKSGLSYKDMQKINSKIIYCALSGFGLTGPYRDRPGYDLIAQATSGMMSVTGEMNGRPQRVGTAISDIVTGFIAAFCIASSLVKKEKTGKGEFIDTSLLDVDLALMAPRITSYLADGIEPKPSGGTDSVVAIYQAIRTADEDMIIATGTDSIFKRFCQAVGLPQLAEEKRFQSNALRKENRFELLRLVEEQLIKYPISYWLKKLNEYSVPCAPINSLGDVVKDPHVLARNMIRTIQHPVAGDVKIVGVPWQLESSSNEVYLPPPLLGQHTAEILKEKLLMSDIEFSELVDTGVVKGEEVRQ